VARAQCSAEGCESDAAWGTRTKPAWCQKHAREKFCSTGMEPREDVVKATTFTLAACVACGTETHVKLEYALEKAGIGESPCRACYWKQWAADVRRLQHNPFAKEDREVQEVAEEHGYEYRGPLTSPSLRDDPHLVRCIDCGRITAERCGDIGWGCQCRKASKTPARPRGAKGELFKDSGSRALTLWDHELNGEAELATAPIGATRKAHWRCPRCGHQWIDSIKNLVASPRCQVCWQGGWVASQAEVERYEGVLISQVPELLAAWAGEADPATILVLTPGSTPTLFRCPRGHRPTMHPLMLLRSGCSVCGSEESNARVERLQSALTETMPGEHVSTRLAPELADQWHPDRNPRLDLRTISPNSKRDVIWRCQECSHEWGESPKSRQYANSLLCPKCRSIFASLAFVMPELAVEWSPRNPRTAWQVRPHGSTQFIPEWICSVNSEHVFEAALSSRASGAGCPECSLHGKSLVELAHHAAADRALGSARSGTRLRTKTGRTWHVDITVEREDLRLVIEYDNSYWHRYKADLDTRKSCELLNEGWAVVRLREHPLRPLPIDEPDRYLELTVYAAAPAPEEVMQRVAAWAGIAVPPVVDGQHVVGTTQMVVTGRDNPLSRNAQSLSERPVPGVDVTRGSKRAGPSPSPMPELVPIRGG